MNAPDLHKANVNLNDALLDLRSRIVVITTHIAGSPPANPPSDLSTGGPEKRLDYLTDLYNITEANRDVVTAMANYIHWLECTFGLDTPSGSVGTTRL